MITALIIVDTRRVTKNGYPLKIRIHDQINSHRYINLKLYQEDKKLIRKPILVQREFQLNQEVDYCNKNGLDLEESLLIFKNGIPDLNDVDSKIALLELELNRLKSKKNITTFNDFYNTYIEDRKNENKSVRANEGRLKKFVTFLESIGRAPNDFMINEIDYELLNEYKNYCLTTGLSIHSFKAYLQYLRAFYIEAQKRKSLNIKSDSPFELLEIKSAKRIVNRNIDLKDFNKFINLDFSDKPKYQLVIDLIKFQFLIGGHDFVELSHLRWEDIKNNKIIFFRLKNSHRGGGLLIDNMIHPLAFEIIEKYGDKSNERIFPFIPINIKNDLKYESYLGVFNKRIKSILIKSELNFKIQTKFIRYTFRTIGGNLMINQMILEKIMGHSNNSISMGYQGATPYEIQDAEHLKVIEAVFK